MERLDILKIFGKNVQAKRKSLGIRQEAFAAKLGFERSYYGRIEQGRINLSLINVLKVSKCLGSSLDELVEGIK